MKLTKKIFLPVLVILSVMTIDLYGQTYADTIILHRQHYKQEFIEEERSPLKEDDTAYLRFYPPAEYYRVVANFVATPGSKVFDMPTHSGKTKKFKQYGIVTFSLNYQNCTLHVYQNQALLKEEEYKKHLFIPFTDQTTYEETYGGGRYIDLSIDDIKDGKIVIDFNKAYNPYCAYSDGYNCPIPPDENKLKVNIHAGEKKFGKGH